MAGSKASTEGCHVDNGLAALAGHLLSARHCCRCLLQRFQVCEQAPHVVVEVLTHAVERSHGVVRVVGAMDFGLEVLNSDGLANEIDSVVDEKPRTLLGSHHNNLGPLKLRGHVVENRPQIVQLKVMHVDRLVRTPNRLLDSPASLFIL